MAQSRDKITLNLPELLCCDVVRRDYSRAVRKLQRKALVSGVYRLNKGGLVGEFLSFLPRHGRSNPTYHL